MPDGYQIYRSALVHIRRSQKEISMAKAFDKNNDTGECGVIFINPETGIPKTYTGIEAELRLTLYTMKHTAKASDTWNSISSWTGKGDRI